MLPIREYLGDVFGRANGSDPCACTVEPASGALRVDATDCPGTGDLAAEPGCRRTVVQALRQDRREEIRVTAHGCERWYTPTATRLLGAAARFAERAVPHDTRLAELATRKPLRAATEVAERAGPVADIAAQSGFGSIAQQHTDIATALEAYEGPTIAASRVLDAPPDLARLRETYETDVTTVRIYDSNAHPVPTYHVEPREAGFDVPEFEYLSKAARALTTGDVGIGEHAHHAAVRAAIADDRESDASALSPPSGTWVASDASDGSGLPISADGSESSDAGAAPPSTLGDDSVDALAGVLRKHTSGFGVLDDLFADPRVGCVYANAPADETVLRVDVDDEAMRTNVCLTSDGAARIASRIRADSGRAFSSASPLIDAVARGVGVADRVRVAGATAPVTDGTTFAFRAGHDDSWRLPDLVANGTLPPDAAAFLGEAVERGRRILIAGPRGAGKTTLLAALLWELPANDRLVAIEDTPELPIADLQAADRDALALRTTTDDDGASVSPADALHAALRLGDGALVVGEVRGREAAVLYEAMRVGANSSAVLGTIHGDGAESVEERVVSDLGVPRSSFAVTDLIATTGHTPSGRRLVGIEEVTSDGFASLYEPTTDGLGPSGRIRRGNSRFLADLANGSETYADIRERVVTRAESFPTESFPAESSPTDSSPTESSPTESSPTGSSSPDADADADENHCSSAAQAMVEEQP